MLRKLLAVVVSSAFLMTSVAAGATEPAKPAPAPAPASQTAATPKNQPPLPPGRAINKAQGEGYSDLGPGVIIGGIVVATGLLFWLMFKDDDDSSSSTGT
jgi:hypothetical protein